MHCQLFFFFYFEIFTATDLSLFFITCRFPKNEERMKKWMSISKVDKINNNSAICSDHFNYYCYHNNSVNGQMRRRYRLKKNADPNTNLERYGF